MPGFSSGGVGGGVGGQVSAPPRPFKPSRYVPVSAATTFLVGSTTLFFCFTSPWLYEYFSPVIPIYIAVIFLFTLANFCMATFMDPGVFPRAEEDEDKEDDFRAPLYKTVEIKGIQVRMKWCSTCRFYRPPRCSHCSVCDNCVEDFDHHCPWVNNCIGRRNYRYFFLFLLSLTTHIVNVFGFGLVYVLHHRQQLDMPHAAVTMAVMCVAGLFFVPVAGLTGFHIVLVARGRTTNEQVTGKFRGGVNPFTNGCARNISRVLCSSLAPRYTGRSRKPQTVEIQPPFLRPPLTEAQLEAKVLDNGIQNDRHSTRSKSSLDQMESQSADTEPPPPPKPELRYPGLPHGDAEESSLLTEGVPPQSVYKYRPAYNSPGRNHNVHTHAGKGYTSPFLSAQLSQQREGHLLQGSATFSSPHRAYLRAVSPPPLSGPPEMLHLLQHNHDSSSSSSRVPRNSVSSSSSPGARSPEPPVSPPPRGLSLGKSQSYTGEAGPQHKLRATVVLGGGGVGGGHQAPQSTSRTVLANHTTSKPGGGVKKVTGVGGTTYEISV
ncbi:palmitoyltransferase ZDHHC5-B isoform X3 [Hippocampus comes]|uniref:palmitoyltransferase ZDHHC5-B isoform X3 n=1 Tax=Hippocampus comes TaxID=109280 RepID=UPI00094F2598|nr:PREDICTED: palmitoyltransferase ZDHHC5 isoform X3 [Hippocampus comes]